MEDLNKERIDELSVNAIRILSADAIQKAKSGHPGLPLGCAPVGYEVWANHLKHNPGVPDWCDRDRFVLSGGHAPRIRRYTGSGCINRSFGTGYVHGGGYGYGRGASCVCF